MYYCTCICSMKYLLLTQSVCDSCTVSIILKHRITIFCVNIHHMCVKTSGKPDYGEVHPRSDYQVSQNFVHQATTTRRLRSSVRPRRVRPEHAGRPCERSTTASTQNYVMGGFLKMPIGCPSFACRNMTGNGLRYFAFWFLFCNPDKAILPWFVADRTGFRAPRVAWWCTWQAH